MHSGIASVLIYGTAGSTTAASDDQWRSVTLHHKAASATTTVTAILIGVLPNHDDDRFASRQLDSTTDVCTPSTIAAALC